MPAAFAHLTLVNVLKERRRLEKIQGFPRPAIAVIARHQKFCELGVVSPDYPYLALGNAGAAKWADKMHYTRVGDMVRAGVDYLRGISGEDQDKGLAWLLGYCAHVATDVTVHPVIELKVGKYEENKLAHRVCEMNQDVYIFKTRMNLDIGVAEFLSSSICACGRAGNPKSMDPAVSNVWTEMMRRVHPDEFAQNPPDIDLWHSRFTATVDNIAEEGYRLVAIARHVAADAGLVYPLEAELDRTYLDSLRCPRGRNRSYDEIFDLAVKNVGTVWNWVANAVLRKKDEDVAAIGHWNLDTGKDENERFVFWA
jgi:hypothetical protein